MGTRRGLVLAAGTLVLFGLAGPGSPRPAGADAIVVSKAMSATTIAEVFVLEDRVRTAIEIGLADLDAFRNVLADEIYARLGHDPLPLEERLPLFFAEDWVVMADGVPLPGRVVSIGARRRVGRDAVTGEPLPSAEGAGEPVLFLVLEHAFETPPASLSIRPPVARDGKYVAANVGFITWHLGVPVTDFRYLGREETLDLDWDDPFFSRYRNRNLKRQYDAPLSVFLYVDAFEVRKEIIARPKDLQTWVDLGLAGEDVIPADAQGALKEKVAAFLRDLGRVTVDGEAITPILDRIHFVRRTLRTTGVIDPPEDLPVASATLGVIFAYPVRELPQRVELAWDLWSPRIQQVPSVATDEAGGLPTILTPEDPVLVWQNFLKNPTRHELAEIRPPRPPPSLPLLSIALGALAALLLVRALRRRGPGRRLGVGLAVAAVGLAALFLPVARVPLGTAGTYAEEDATPVVGGLLGNVYRAFDYRDESDIYDALAKSVDGELLENIYLETRRSLELANQGGARAKVQGVEIQEAVPSALEDGPGFRARCTWQVDGSVGHWGHIHRRGNRYDAELRVEPVDGVWKITDLEVLSEERL